VAREISLALKFSSETFSNNKFTNPKIALLTITGEISVPQTGGLSPVERTFNPIK